MNDLPRFFVAEEKLVGDLVIIDGSDAHHITRVLRLKPGDFVECVDGCGRTHQVEIATVGTFVQGYIRETVLISQEPPLYFTLFQGLAKGDKMDWVLQKAVELGVNEIVPFSSAHTVVRLNSNQVDKRIERWKRIVQEAAKQCGRTRLPTLDKVDDFASLMGNLAERSRQGDLVLVANECEKEKSLGDISERPHSVSIIIGPEGGFSKEEIWQLKEVGAQSISLGPRILRTETAGLVALSLLGYKWGDLG